MPADRRLVESATAGSRRRASSSGCTPLFLNAEPHSTGIDLELQRRLADRRADLGLVDRLRPRGTSRAAPHRCRRPLRASCPRAHLGRRPADPPESPRCGSGRRGCRRPRATAFMVTRSMTPRKLFLAADGQLDGHRRWRRGARGSSPTPRLEVGADAVHLVDERDARHTYLSACRQTVSDCGSTPPTEQNTATAPSSTRSERSTSMVKSTWPGVSMMLTRWSRQWQVVAADVMVMPRSCSCTIQSIVAVPSCTSPIL